jgi:hypothetical protein
MGLMKMIVGRSTKELWREFAEEFAEEMGE